MAWPIAEVARMSGVTARTLRHYDEVGLLPPAWIGSNGHRYYEESELGARRPGAVHGGVAAGVVQGRGGFDEGVLSAALLRRTRMGRDAECGSPPTAGDPTGPRPTGERPYPLPMPHTELHRINAFLTAFARRQAARVVDLPGGFAVYDDALAHSRANNQVFVEEGVDSEALPALADEALGHLPHRLVSVLDDEVATACAEPLLRAGYTHSTYLVMLHAGPVPAGGPAEEVDLDAIRTPLTRRWQGFLPGVDEEVIRHLVDRREARRRGADVVRFVGARTEEGEVASWADLYLDQASGTAQIEDLVTSEAHLGHGYADAVLTTALRLAVDGDCGTRFLTADAADWPRHWYERRGFTVIGHSHCFERS